MAAIMWFLIVYRTHSAKLRRYKNERKARETHEADAGYTP
jgi:hypothetical protein